MTVTIIIGLIASAFIGYICGYGLGKAFVPSQYMKKRIDTLDSLQHLLLEDGTHSKKFFEGALWAIENTRPGLDKNVRFEDTL